MRFDDFYEYVGAPAVMDGVTRESMCAISVFSLYDRMCVSLCPMCV